MSVGEGRYGVVGDGGSVDHGSGVHDRGGVVAGGLVDHSVETEICILILERFNKN